MNKELFERYAKLERDIKEMEDEKERMRAMLIDEMKDTDTEKVVADFGTFSLTKRTTYKFSETVNEEIKGLKEKIKDVENNAVSAGEAEEVITESIRFQLKK